MSSLITFENMEFGKLTVMEKDGEFFFIGKEVAEKLGYARGRKAVSFAATACPFAGCALLCRGWQHVGAFRRALYFSPAALDQKGQWHLAGNAVVSGLFFLPGSRLHRD